MIRTLYVVRHAKAEDRAIFLPDHNRNLTPEGIIEAARVGRHLHRQGIRPDVIVSSTAFRARDTAKVMAEQLGINPDEVVLDEKLFDHGPKAYMAAVNALDDAYTSAMVVGHNPDVSYFVEFLTHQNVGSMRKGGVVAVTFEGLNWAEMAGRTGRVTFDMSPKSLGTDAAEEP